MEPITTEMKNQIFDMYKTMSIGKSEICCTCREYDELTKPLSIYFIGEDFGLSKDSILFVGKTAGDAGAWPLFDDLFFDTTNFGEKSLDGVGYNKGNYFSYTHSIIKKYYGSYETGKKNVALTNMVKCNNGSTYDTSVQEVKQSCIKKLGIIWREIELLSPNRIVFYTSDKYDSFIEEYSPSTCQSFTNITSKDHDIKIGSVMSRFWHRRFFDNNNEIICDFLRLDHPERKSKDFVEKVVQWLQQTKRAI